MCRSAGILSLTLFLIVSQQFQNRFLDPGSTVAFGEIFPQILGAEADFIDLVGLGFPENIEDPVNIQFSGLTQPLHLDRLGEGGGAVLTLHGLQQILLFQFG